MALSKDEMRSPHPNLGVLSTFLDGHLSEADRTVCIDHLSECEECRTLLATFVRGSVPPVAAPAGNGRLASGPRFGRAAIWLPIAATLMVATAAGVMVSRMSPSSPTTSPDSPPSSPPSPISPAVPEAAPSRSTLSPSVNPPGAAVDPTPGAPTAPPDSLATRRGGERLVGGTTFRLVAGEWIDARYDPLGLLPVEVIDNPAARTAVLLRRPALAPYAALGPKVVVVHDGVVYRFRQ